jgi:hypothetical protein
MLWFVLAVVRGPTTAPAWFGLVIQRPVLNPARTCPSWGARAGESRITGRDAPHRINLPAAAARRHRRRRCFVLASNAEIRRQAAAACVVMFILLFTRLSCGVIRGVNAAWFRRIALRCADGCHGGSVSGESSVPISTFNTRLQVHQSNF